MQSYREYQRIKNKLKEHCKEADNKNWEDKIYYISDNSKHSKDFWNQIKILKGRNTTHVNYMKDQDGNKYYTDKEKCTLMEKNMERCFQNN